MHRSHIRFLYNLGRLLLFACALFTTKACVYGGRKTVLPAVSSILNYAIMWENETTIDLKLTIPEVYRTQNGSLDLVLSHTQDMENVYYEQKIHVTGQESVSFSLPINLFESEQRVYWQVAWLPQNPALSHQLLTPYPMEIRMFPASAIEFLRPTENDEVPADIVRFEVRIDQGEQPVDLTIGVSRSSDFSTYIASWHEQASASVFEWKPNRAFPMGQLYAWTYFVQYDETRSEISKPVKISFQTTTPCSKRNGSPYAVRIIDAQLNCPAKNRYMDPSKALGPPDATQFGEDSFTGIVSLGVDGWIIVQNGKCVTDGPGEDIRIYQVVSYEGVEVFVSENRNGPYISLGTLSCGDYWSGGLANICQFDLAESGLRRAAYIRVDDRIRVTHPYLGDCAWQTVTTPGADIDAVEILH